jgi:DNA-binding NarL/FixJ family response regulator
MATPIDESLHSDLLLRTLEGLLALDALELQPTLNQASQVVAEALGADKVDVFLLDTAKATLAALGTSDTPMGRLQHAIGMDRLPLANGGRAVQVFENGESYLSDHADQDPEELRGITQGLGVRSQVVCPVTVDGERRGVLQVMSERPEAFEPRDLRFVEAVARWIGMLTHRAELVEHRVAEAAEQGRIQAAEELLLKVLTPRQREVALLIALGLTNEQIAERLVITHGSVGNHIERILDRLGAQRRGQIAAWIVERGLSLPDVDSDSPA